MQTSILLADEQQMVREGLQHILKERSDFEVVAEAGDGEEALRVACDKKPDIVLIELHLPRLSGPETVRRIRDESHGTRCIMLTSQVGRSQVEEALAAGASGYVPKSCGSKELMDAIDSVRMGRSYLAPLIAEHAIRAIRPSNRSSSGGVDRLTRREREVLLLVAEGLSTVEIGAKLGISVKTAQTHRSNIMTKWGAHKVSNFVRQAIREGIVPVYDPVLSESDS